MDEQKKMGVCLLGACAGIANAYISAIIKIPQLELKAVMDVVEDDVKQLACMHSCKAFTDAEEAVNSPGIDVVIITTPDYMHCQHTVISAAAGKHIICTKPLTLNLEDAQKMQKAVDKNGVIFMCGMNMRYSSWIQTIKQCIIDENIGEVVFVRWINKGDYYSYPKGHFYRTAASGGQLVHNGAHYLDAMSFWLGDRLPVSIHGVATCNISDDEKIEFNNYHNLSVGFEDGAIGHLEYNQLLVNPRGYPTTMMTTIIGKNGMLEMGLNDMRGIELYSNGKITYPQSSWPEDNGFSKMLNVFVGAIVNNETSPLPITHSIKILETCIKGQSACATQSVIKI